MQSIFFKSQKELRQLLGAESQDLRGREGKSKRQKTEQERWQDKSGRNTQFCVPGNVYCLVNYLVRKYGESVNLCDQKPDTFPATITHFTRC